MPTKKRFNGGMALSTRKWRLLFDTASQTWWTPWGRRFILTRAAGSFIPRTARLRVTVGGVVGTGGGILVGVGAAMSAAALYCNMTYVCQ